MAVVALVAAASCGRDDETAGDDAPTTPTAAPTVGVTPSPEPDPTATPAPDPTATPSPTATPTPDPTATPAPDGDLELANTCDNPDGFAVAYPAGWYTVEAGLTGACGYFAPDPIDAPTPGTDERPGPLSIYVESVRYRDFVDPDTLDADQRAVTAVDGRQALRTHRVADGDGLYPDGTPVTLWAVDLSVGVDDGAGTLVASAVGFGGVDHDEAVAALDAMVRSLDIAVGDEAVADDIVARFEGGGAPFTVSATVEDGRVCFVADTGTAETCVPADATAPSDAEPLDLGPAGEATVGLAAPDIDVVETAGGFAFAPVPVGGGPAAYVLPFAPDETAELRHVTTGGGG